MIQLRDLCLIFSEMIEADQKMSSKWLENIDGMFDDGEKFSLQIFTDPIDLQKHLEEQMQQVIEAVSEFESKTSITNCMEKTMENLHILLL